MLLKIANSIHTLPCGQYLFMGRSFLDETVHNDLEVWEVWKPWFYANFCG